MIRVSIGSIKEKASYAGRGNKRDTTLFMVLGEFPTQEAFKKGLADCLPMEDLDFRTIKWHDVITTSRAGTVTTPVVERLDYTTEDFANVG